MGLTYQKNVQFRGYNDYREMIIGLESLKTSVHYIVGVLNSKTESVTTWIGKHLQCCDERKDLGEGQADQTSKYLGLRIFRSLGELSLSIRKFGFLVLKRLRSILKKCRPKSFFAGLLALLGGYPQTSSHHEKRDAYPG
jgi:hypothetical protein